MRAADIIIKKRDNQPLNEQEINFFIEGYVQGSIPAYQVSAWLMAVYLNGMSFEEAGLLTRAMIASGKTVNLQALAGKPLADKHSTGGVGDKISLPLAPLAAAMGLYVPMMSGRALGITGGTLDKLESIPGYNVRLNEELFAQEIAANGYAMIGQSEGVVPADKLMYALRDVTGTVESVPLITASILSKKFAEGAQSLVFDVKCGSGAFMKTYAAAKTLAESLTRTARSLNRKTYAMITDMSQPLGLKTGNFLEVEESVDCLRGQGPKDVMELVCRQAACMALAGGLARSVEEGLEQAAKALQSGEAERRFWLNIERQGGDAQKTKAMLGVERAPFWAEIKAARDGFAARLDAETIGRACIALGVGRNQTEDAVDALAGIEFFKKRGDAVKQGESLCRLYAMSEEKLAAALALAERAAYSIEPLPPPETKLIMEEIAAW